MKILIATAHTYPPQRVGGSESSMHGLCRAFEEHGAEVAVFCRWSPLEAGAGPYLAYALANPSHRIVRDEPFGYPIFRAGRPVTAAVPEAIRAARPDVAIVNAGRPVALAESFMAQGIPTVVYVRDAFFDKLGGRPRSHPLVRYVAVSNEIARRFDQAFGILPICIPPIVYPDLYRVDSARKNVTFICPVPLKGLEIALQLAERRPDIPFVFVESWPVRPVSRLLRYLRLRKLNNVVLRQSVRDAREIYRDTKIALVPSVCAEAWGRVVSEAQVSGIPILASDIGGLPESVGPGGLLVSPEALGEEWERALSAMWDDTETYDRLVAQVQQHAVRPEFEPAVLADRLFGVISELVSTFH